MATATPTRTQLPEWLADGIDAEPNLRAALERKSDLEARRAAIVGEISACTLASQMSEEQASEHEIGQLAGTSTKAAAAAARQHAEEIAARPADLRREQDQIGRALSAVAISIDRARGAARQQALDAVRPVILEKFARLCAAVQAASGIDAELRALRFQLGDSAAGLPGGTFRELFVAPDFSPAGQHPTLFGGSFAERLMVWQSCLADGSL